MSKFEKSKFEEWLKKYYDGRSSRYTFEYIYRKTELKENITQGKMQWYLDKIREDKIERRTFIDSEVMSELRGDPIQSPKEEKNVFLDVQHYEYKYHDKQRVVWDLEVFKQISNILEDTTITEVTVQDSTLSYITPIKRKKTLANILDATQLYYNQISKDDKRTQRSSGCFLTWIEQKKGGKNDIIIEFLDSKSERYSQILKKLINAPNFDVQHEKYLDWIFSVFKQISDILNDTTITEVTVQDSSYSNIIPIRIRKTLYNIIHAIQLFYNQISKDDLEQQSILIRVEQKTRRDNDILIEFSKGLDNTASQSLKEEKYILLDYQHYKEKFAYGQCVNWDLSVFKQISDILEDTTITEVTVQDSSYSYITPIKIKKTLSNIMDTIELFYNQISKDDRRTNFYLESVKPFERKKNHVMLEITHGKLYTWVAQFFRPRKN